VPAPDRPLPGVFQMIELRRAGLSAALLIASSMVFAACGGATPTPTPTPTPAPAGEATPPSAEATPTPAPETGATPAVALPTFDLGALSGGLPGVDSYRTETSVGGVKQYESVVVTKPVLSKAITIYDAGDISARLVIVGDQAWKADGANGAFEAVPSQMASSMLMLFDPALMLGGFAGLDWAQAASNQGVEEKNGVQAHHVRIDSTTFVGAAAAMPAGSAIDAWIADAGYLVAWEMSGFPEDANFSIQVTGVNDPANKVEAPV
jgi:hypothetical protein